MAQRRRPALMLSNHLQEKGLHWAIQALLGALLLGGLGPVVIDMEGTLPLSLQSLMVCWIPIMIGWRAGLTTVLLYLLGGVAGLPLFADGRHGMEVLAGPTGGYLLGFPIVAFLLGYAGDMAKALPLRSQYAVALGGMLVGHMLILAFGIPWQMQFNPNLDPMNLLERLARPVALKSAIGLLLSVVVLRGAQGRA
ncbi:MAG: hypothetical protein CMC97_05970 [Flavobacteriales bacterium]|nr:hypothetical protein [Flavobacteriales bacterium]